MGLYSPQDTKSAVWGGSLIGRDVGSEMQRGHEALDAQDAEGRAEYAKVFANNMAQSAHERGLQSAEQQRRLYDSQTQRLGQQQKYGVLGGLLGGMR
jgi:hypothetical protein